MLFLGSDLSGGKLYRLYGNAQSNWGYSGKAVGLFAGGLWGYGWDYEKRPSHL